MRNTWKKMMALVIAMVMVLAMGVTVFAQTVGTDAEGKGSITVRNAAKGETYKVVKLFDATLTEDGTGINYSGTIPDALKDYFVKDSIGNITKKSGVENSALIAAVQDWAKEQSGTSVVSDGSVLTFEGLDYGYYAVTSTQGAVVSVDSTMPDVIINDKNTKTPSAEKTVDDTSYSIGDTITYTATFDTANWLGEGDSSKQVLEYVIEDTLPEYLSNVNVTGITVGGTAITTQQFTNKKITLEWATEDAGSDPKTYTSKYSNGAKIVITYTAKLTSTVNVNAANKNTVKITPNVWNPDTKTKEPWNESWDDDAEVTTYAAALKKTDGSAVLDGAEFTIAGLTVTKDADGVYTVVSYDSESTTPSATLTTKDGMLYIIGLKEGTSLSVTETKAPEGYNKLETPITLTPQVLSKEVYKASGTRYYDADGNLVAEESSSESNKPVEKNLTELDANAVEVVNNKGTELPSTGGFGTTIFYVIGAILVLGAGVLLVTRRRMIAN